LRVSVFRSRNLREKKGETTGREVLFEGKRKLRLKPPEIFFRRLP